MSSLTRENELLQSKEIAGQVLNVPHDETSQKQFTGFYTAVYRTPDSVQKNIKSSPSYMLPRSYGETKVIILPRDPSCFYAYWDRSDNTISELKRNLGEDVYRSSHWLLRVYDVTDTIVNASRAPHFDIILNNDADNWYIHVNERSRTYYVDLGLVTPDGVFIPVARSNILNLPQFGFSENIDEEWGILRKEFERLMELAGIDGTNMSSHTITKLVLEQFNKMITINLPSSGKLPAMGIMPSSARFLSKI
jgi:hypothetical protein